MAKNDTQRGDTIIEVMISLAVFSLVAVVSVTIMNNGLNAAQRSLEISMARLAIDAQADTLDYIREGAYNEAGKSSNAQDYTHKWEKITNKAVLSTNVTNPTALDLHSGTTSCSAAISRIKSTFGSSVFALNPRGVIPVDNNGKTLRYATTYTSTNGLMNENSFLVENTIVSGRSMIADGGLYPRILYTSYDGTDLTDSLVEDTYYSYRKVDQVQNIWIVAIKEGSDENKSKYYDFYIQTCWESPGASTFVTLSTIKRVYNLESKL